MNISSRIAGVSAFFLAVALFYAPLAYGCTRPEMLPTLFELLMASIVTGVISFVANRRWPAIPRLALVCVTAILVQGWWITWNPVFPSLVSANGGFVDTTLENIRRLSFNSMALTSLSLGSFVVLCELFGNANLRRFILLAAALSGTLISVIGIVLKLTGEPLMRYVWKPMDIYWNDFAFFRYHGNAGAFLNLAWPLILVFTRRAYSPTVSVAQKIVWTLCTLACAGALFLNASKAALIIGLFVLPWPFLTRLTRLRGKVLFLLGAVSLLVIVGGLAASSELAQEAAFQRMTNASEVSSSFDGRVEAYQQYLNALPAVGCFGLGPGLFQIAFPYQTSPLGNVSVALREFAHEDYLQTVLEWGWLGTLWWFLLVAGGLYRAMRTYAQRELFPSKTERHLVLAAILGVCATLALALIDFPLQVASTRLFFLVLLALCWASPQLLTTPPEDPSPRRRYRLPIPSAAMSRSKPALVDLDDIAGMDFEGGHLRGVGHRSCLDFKDGGFACDHAFDLNAVLVSNVGEPSGEKNGVNDAHVGSLGDFIDTRSHDLPQNGKGAFPVFQHRHQNVGILHEALGVTLLNQVRGFRHRFTAERNALDQGKQHRAIRSQFGPGMKVLLAINGDVDDVIGRQLVGARYRGCWHGLGWSMGPLRG